MAGDVSKISLRVPTPARIYDYLLGGKDNFEVDRAAAARLMDAIGADHARDVVWETRRFLWRVVEYLAGERVVYVDNDPIVFSHGQALLATNGDTAVITADMRRPEEILDHPDTRALIDFSRPVAV